MSAVQLKSRGMSVAAIREKARGLGIEPGKMKKADLVRAIQTTEGNTACYGHSQGQCSHVDCCFMYDCLKIKA